MKIAVGIVSLFSGGGLQRDCLRVIEALRRRGHQVEVFAARCDPALMAKLVGHQSAPSPQGERGRASESPSPLGEKVADGRMRGERHEWNGPGPATGAVSNRGVTVLPTRGFSNHARDASFAAAFEQATRAGFDVVVGFNKLTGLDVLYCADPSAFARPLPAWRRALPRHRTRRDLEAASFAPESRTHILLLSEPAAELYRTIWHTPAERITVLPPTVAANRVRPELRSAPTRAEQRRLLGLGTGDLAWLWIAGQPQVKGLDRAITALAGQKDARLIIVGTAEQDPKAKAYVSLAGKLGAADRIRWLGHREDIPELMAAADVLLHPARFDTTGQVILEAIVNGLPVITTKACGFASLVEAAGVGVALEEPFDQSRLDEALSKAADATQRADWSRAGLGFAAAQQFTRGFEIAADLIEQAAASKVKG